MVKNSFSKLSGLNFLGFITVPGTCLRLGILLMKVLSRSHKRNIRNLERAFVDYRAQDASLDLIGRVYHPLEALIYQRSFLSIFMSRSSVIGWPLIINLSEYLYQ